MIDKTPFLSRFIDFQRSYTNPILAAILLLAGLYAISLYNYLLFHILAELFAIIIAFTTFVLTWNARRILQNGALLFLGSSLLYVAIFDLMHTLAYRGMGVFGVIDANLATQFWLAARYTQAVSFFIAPLLLRRLIKPHVVIPILGVVCGALFLSIYPYEVFPLSLDDTPGGGITPFKVYSEYAVIALLTISLGLFLRIREDFDREVWSLLTLSIAVMIVAEYFFTLYITIDDIRNLIGHFLKIIAFYLIYRAIIDTGFRKPQETLYYDLARSERALRTSEAGEKRQLAELEAIMEAVPAVVWITLDPQSTYVKGNRAAVDLLRMKPDENLSLSAPRSEAPLHFKVVRNGRELETHELPLQYTAATGKPLRNYEETIVFDDGKQIHLLGNVSPLLDEQGNPSGAVAAFIDITGRKQVEEEANRYARQLENSNRELQEFAFVASHDLQEPLRKIQAFGDRLGSHLEGKLDEETRDYLERMNRASQRMRTMIEDLLSLSRVTTRARSFERVSLDEVLAEVISDLEPRIQRANGHVEIKKLPVVEADPLQMHQLFQNLVGNGLKFHRDGVPPVVNVSSTCSQDGAYYIISVEDNGIGFDDKYTDRIFQPFQRLHGIGKYEGSGIGLAICRKIVERHEGTITAKGKPDQGATFIIRLPAHQSGRRILTSD